MLRAYPDPRASVRRQLGEGVRESQALFFLMAACGLFFVASMPAAIRAARALDTVEPVSAAVGAHLFGFLFAAPLLFYAAALVVHGVCRLVGGRGTALEVRIAVFWSLLLAAPLTLGVALVGAVVEVAAGPDAAAVAGALGYGVFGLWIWFFSAGLAEAEGFGHSGRVAAGFVAALGLVAGSLVILSGATPAAG
jgi:hypothetical protein